MMPKESAGLLVYRFKGGNLEVFLVHPGGPFWSKKDDGSWSIPKGEYPPTEKPLDAARREFREETGTEMEGDSLALEPVRQPGGKIVHAWAVEGELDPLPIKSNTFRLEWPRGSGKFQEFPEIDKAGWFSIDKAAVKILKGQMGLLEQLRKNLAERKRSGPATPK
jgi:predicted NUDIX family NTP pyrophosphohydrolase